MIFFVLLFVAGLAFQAQVVLAASFSLNISTVQQCEPVSISFTGTNRTTILPMTLSILPVNGSPIFIPIPDNVAAPSGVYVSFLPLAAGTTFLASLDDSSGDNLAHVSDIIKVMPSPNNNSTCLPSSSSQSTSQTPFLLASPISQCSNFTVTYSAGTRAPTIRLYSPRGASFVLKQTSVDAQNGSATYLMNFFRGLQVLLLLDGGVNDRQTTSIFTVGGDSSSSHTCFSSGNTTSSASSQTSSNNSPGISRAVVIGSSVGGGSVLFIAMAMVLYIMRERRRRAVGKIEFDPARMEKGPTDDKRGRSPTPTFNEKSYFDGAVKDPLYTAGKYSPTPSKSKKLRSSLASWAQIIPDDQRYPATKATTPLATAGAPPSFTRQSQQSVDNLSLNSLDIEGMLNMATMQSQSSSGLFSRKSSDPAPYYSPAFASSSQLLTVPQPIATRPYPARGHLRDPSDVPADPTSMALSGYSLNPFFNETNDRVVVGPASQQTTNYPRSPLSTLRYSRGGVVGLPSSPRVGRNSKGTEDRFSRISESSWRASRSSWGSEGDQYGVAR